MLIADLILSLVLLQKGNDHQEEIPGAEATFLVLLAHLLDVNDLIHVIDVERLLHYEHEWLNHPALLEVFLDQADPLEILVLLYCIFEFCYVHVDGPIVERLVFEVLWILELLVDHELFEGARYGDDWLVGPVQVGNVEHPGASAGLRLQLLECVLKRQSKRRHPSAQGNSL